MIPIINEHSIENGESVQSFIFRVSAMHGYIETDKNLKGLVGKNGLWHEVPVLLPYTRYLFEEFDEHYLAQLVKTSDIINSDLELFTDPTRYTKALKETFYNEADPKVCNGNKEINFCLECIQYDILKRGFGYFRASWHRAIYCPVHNTRLLTAIVHSPKEALNAINKILRGQYPEKYSESNTKKFGDLLHHTMYARNFKIKCSPCLREKLLHWLRKNYERLDESVAERAKLKREVGLYQLLRYTTGRYKYVSNAQLEKVLIAMQPKYNTLLQNFMLSNAELIQVNCGVTRASNLTEPLVIAKGNSCGYCTKFSGRCPAAVRLIMSWPLGEGSRFSYSRNPCDYLLEHYWHLYGIT